jgi:death-on-curing protein
VREPDWLTTAEILAIQEALLAEHGGKPGLRDANPLESALARPRNLYAYGSPTLGEMAAAYGFGLAKNHPFVDGNKRAALAAIGVFLDLNGYDLVAAEPDAVFTILGLAAGEVSGAQLAAWIESNSRPADR